MAVTADPALLETASMPAEWAPHAACWMAWPCRPKVWGPHFDRVRGDYARVAQAIHRFEPVMMVARPQDADEARRRCGPGITIVPLPIDDSWLRDSGPTFLRLADGRQGAVAWRFNAWGGKYHPHDADAAVGARIAVQTGAILQNSALVAEGGALHVDGDGTLLTTESCLLNPNRNPGWSRAGIEAELQRRLGVRKVIWLPGDPAEDETDGHIDGLACFIRPGAAMIEVPQGRDDPRYEVLTENRRALELATDARGRRLELLPIEEAHEAAAVGPRYCRSYINFYLANGGVLVPAYGTPGDQRAREAVARAFPDREVVLVDLGMIAFGGGGIHCITQQQPLVDAG